MSDENREVPTDEAKSTAAPVPAETSGEKYVEPDDHEDEHYDDKQEAHDHRDGDYEDDHRPAPQPRREEVRQPLGPADEYQFQVHFDRKLSRYVGSCAEFSEIRTSANSPEQALEDIRMAIEDHVELVRRRNEPVAEPLGSKVYPASITLNLSQGLYRRLDHLSRHEKVALDQLVGELLSGAVEKRFDPARSGGGGGANRQQQSRDGGGNHSRNDQGNHGNRRPHGGGNHGGGQGGGQGGGRHGGGGGGGHRGSRSSEMMENRESFMEYVRNLEKGGGPYKKR